MRLRASWLIVLLLAPWLVGAAPASAASCQYVLGFKTLADAVPQVGACLDDESYDANGAQQHTTGGLLVWRQSDGFTAFTNGAITWVNGPYGIQKRSNDARFCWESDATVSCGQLPPPSNADLRFSLAGVSPGSNEVHGQICNHSRQWDAFLIHVEVRSALAGRLSQSASPAEVPVGTCLPFTASLPAGMSGPAVTIAQTSWSWRPHAR